MPVTSANFVYENQSAADQAKFDLALAYLQMSPAGAALVSSVVGLTINFVHGTENEDLNQYHADTGVLDWDPDMASMVYSANGTVGTDSSALSLAHEMAHRADPNLTTEPDPEDVATAVQNQVASQLGEASQANYTDNTLTVPVNNPTLHSSGTTWVEREPDGTTTTGGTYNPNQATPREALIN